MNYLLLKQLHMGLAALSGTLFLLRGSGMLARSPLLAQRWVRSAPHVVDSLLLASALALATWSGQNPSNSPWLAAKIAALVAYILFGAVALRYGKPPPMPLIWPRTCAAAPRCAPPYCASPISWPRPSPRIRCSSFDEAIMPQLPSTNDIFLDLRGLVPPEPMERTLDALANLQAGQQVRIVIDREPVPLFRILERNAYTYRQSSPGIYDIVISQAS